MAFLSSLDIAGSGMTAQRRRLDVIAENIANRDTTRTADGEPYRRKLSVFREITPAAGAYAQAFGTQQDQGRYARYMQSTTQDQGEFYQYIRKAAELNDPRPKGGVMVAEVFEDTTTPLIPVYDPNHPDANEEGYVMMPNVDTTMEMVDAMAATRSYSANISAFEAIKSMAKLALEIGK
jgi:flagellar basal-body rod protein FlgC